MNKIAKYWIYISNLGVKPDLEMEQQKKIILSNQIAVIFFFVFILLNIAVEVFYVSQSIWAHISAFSILLMPVVNSYGYNRLTSILVNVLTPGFTLLLSTVAKLSLIENVPIYGYIFPRIMLISYLSLPFILIGKKQKLLMASMLIVNLIYIFIFDTVHAYFGVSVEQVHLDLSTYPLTNYFIVFPILVITLGYFFLTNINEKYEDKVLQLVDQLEDKNKRITDSILYAERIQAAFMPEKENYRSITRSGFVLYLPRDIVSGDFYWVHEWEQKRIIIAADCTGHGVPGAFVSVLGITLLNDIVIRRQIHSPEHILNELRKSVKDALKQHRDSTQKDGMDMAVCLIDDAHEQLYFAGAYNSAYIVRGQQLLELKADRMPVGVYQKEKPFGLQMMKLEKNDSIYLFSDGYASQFGSPENKKLKISGFKEIILLASALPIHEQQVFIHNKLNDWQQGADQVDDILVLGIQI